MNYDDAEVDICWYVSRKMENRLMKSFINEGEVKMENKYVKGSFMVGSVTKTSTRSGYNPTIVEGVSFSAQPKTHPSWADAKAEAERLTKAHPDKEFLVVEIKGRAKSVGVEWK